MTKKKARYDKIGVGYDSTRKAISSFSLLNNRVEIEQGLKEMRADIDSGKIKEIMSEYENDLGDYLFVIIQKKNRLLISEILYV